MRIGDYFQTLQFQAPSGSPVAWTTIFTCKGSYRGLTGAESVAALSGNSTITGTVRIPWRLVPIKTTWRVLCDGKVLNIASPAIDTRYPEGRFWIMKVREVA